MSPARLIARLGGVGDLRPAPGTWGSLAALPLAWLIAQGGLGVFLLAIAAAFAAGLWATAHETRDSDDPDPSAIVIDEVVGQWIALVPVIAGATLSGAPLTALWPGWLGAFVLFRLFDIWKPGPVGWADRRHDALGVMLDDVLAGAFAALAVSLLAGLAHGIFLG